MENQEILYNNSAYLAKNVPEIKNQQEYDFMLSELSVMQSRHDQLLDRIEKIVTFYLTGMTAIGSAIIVLTTSVNNLQLSTMTFSFLLVAMAGFGTGSFLRLCNSKVMTATSHAIVESRRLYFIERFPHIKKYVETRTKDDLLITSRETAFTTQVIIILMVVAAINMAMAGMAVTLVVYELGILISVDLPLALLTFIGLSISILGLAINGLYLYKKVIYTQSHTENIMTVAFSDDTLKHENTNDINAHTDEADTTA